MICYAFLIYREAPFSAQIFNISSFCNNIVGFIGDTGIPLSTVPLVHQNFFWSHLHRIAFLPTFFLFFSFLLGPPLFFLCSSLLFSFPSCSARAQRSKEVQRRVLEATRAAKVRLSSARSASIAGLT